MPKILLTNYYSERLLSIIEGELSEGFELITLTKPGKDEIIKNIMLADYLLVGGRVPIDKEVIDSATNLKMIQRTGVGLDSLDLELLKKRNIPVYVNFGVNSQSVAEHTIMLILAVLRRLPIVNASVKKGEWIKHEHGVQTNELFGKVVGLIGLGNIGKEVAKLLHPFGVKILYHDKIRLSTDIENEMEINFCSLPELYQKADIISLHCPLTSETKGMIGTKEIASMKPGVIIINTSRGQLIVEDALINNLENGHIKGAGLDVFAEEPVAKNSKLLSLENVVLTPHIGGITLESFKRMMSEAFYNIMKYDSGDVASLESKRLHF
jgi:D-3-phosphoglycerate dehydrogenase